MLPPTAVRLAQTPDSSLRLEEIAVYEVLGEAPVEAGDALVHPAYGGLLLQDALYRCSRPLP